MNPGTMVSNTMDLAAIESTTMDPQNGLHNISPATMRLAKIFHPTMDSATLGPATMDLATMETARLDTAQRTPQE